MVDHGRRRPRARSRGCAVLGLRHGRAALHVARHGHRARVAARRVPRTPRRPARERRPSATRSSDVLYGPMLDRALRRSLRRVPRRADRSRTTSSSAAPQRDGSPPRTRETGFLGDPDEGVFCHPTIVDGVRADDELAVDRDVRPDGRSGQLLGASTRPWRSPTSPATASPRPSTRGRPRRSSRSDNAIVAGMVSVNNSTSGAEAHLPFGGNGKSGNGSRQSGTLGPRPGHSLAVAELGLLRAICRRRRWTPTPSCANRDFRLAD